MASTELREELESKPQEELAAMAVANGLLTSVVATSVSEEQLINLLMEAADAPLPPEAERDAP